MKYFKKKDGEKGQSISFDDETAKNVANLMARNGFVETDEKGKEVKEETTEETTEEPAKE